MIQTQISPSITATYAEEYARQIERVSPFASRLHIDIGDGIFTPNKLIDPNEVWWPGGIRADIHVMYKRPIEVIDTLLALSPQLVIVQAEAEGDFALLSRQLHYHGIEAGISLMPQTPVDFILPGIDAVDHVTIFSGDLGHFGGTVDLSLLEKVRRIKQVNPRIEIGWDGGAKPDNVAQLAAAGVDVIVSGGYIQKAEHPADAYATLKKALAG